MFFNIRQEFSNMASEWLEALLLANWKPYLECKLTNMDFNIFSNPGPWLIKTALTIQAYTNESQSTMKVSEGHSFMVYITRYFPHAWSDKERPHYLQALNLLYKISFILTTRSFDTWHWQISKSSP